MKTSDFYMQQALQLAARGKATVSPNPMVGCVIVKNGQVIATGYHERKGEAHAEIHALKEAGPSANGASLYVTLEPCCHYGATPPCTDAIIEAKIKKVYIAVEDPNPLVAGKGISALQKHGIEVEVGIATDAASKLNEVFFHYIKTKRPFVIAKWAMSLDGKTITHEKDSAQISSSQSIITTHILRQTVDAILIGARTAIKDNPKLTVRYLDDIIKHPIRLILSSRGQLPLELALFDADLPGQTIVVTTEHIKAERLRQFEKKNIEVLQLIANDNQQVDLSSLLQALGKRQITSLLVEGGMNVHHQFLQENLINRLQVYLAPVLIGQLEKKRAIEVLSFALAGGDIQIMGNL